MRWRRLRNAYMQSQHYLCERCKKNGKIVTADIVHHKEYITSENINDESITLNWDNLESLCIECHNKEHFLKPTTQFSTDGHPIKRADEKINLIKKYF